MNGSATNPASIWSIGSLLPRLMLFFFLIDLILRFVPLDPFTFRAWEAMLRHYPNAIGPFTEKFIVTIAGRPEPLYFTAQGVIEGAPAAQALR